MSKVSIIVATYRREYELEKALDSLKDQQYKNIEIIVVDDNADEYFNKKVIGIVDSFKKTNPDLDVKLITNPVNKGSAETRNIGINASFGEYITFLDDDDVYMPEKIKKQVEFMENGNYDYSITDLELFNKNGKLIRKRTRSYIKDTSEESLFKYHLMYHLTGTDSMMFKKEYLNAIEGFAPIDVGDEFYLMVRAINGKGKFGYLPCCDIKAFVHTGECGLSSGDSKIIGENNLYEYKKLFFDKLDKKTIRYIKMRHYAVLAFAEIRRRNIWLFLRHSLRAFSFSPVSCIRMFLLER